MSFRNPVPFLHGGGADCRQIAAGVGLRHSDGLDEVAGYAAGQIAALLLLRTVLDQVVQNHGIVQPGREPREIGPGQFLDNHDLVEKIGAGSAVGLGNAHPEIALLPHLLPSPPGDDSRLFPLFDVGNDFLGQELLYGVPEDAMLLRIRENFHVMISF